MGVTSARYIRAEGRTSKPNWTVPGYRSRRQKTNYRMHLCHPNNVLHAIGRGWSTEQGVKLHWLIRALIRCKLKEAREGNRYHLSISVMTESCHLRLLFHGTWGFSGSRSLFKLKGLTSQQRFRGRDTQLSFHSGFAQNEEHQVSSLNH